MVAKEESGVGNQETEEEGHKNTKATKKQVEGRKQETNSSLLLSDSFCDFCVPVALFS
jgi:hypothetical protein